MPIAALGIECALLGRGLTNVGADKHFWMRLRRDGNNVLAAELGR